MESNTYSIQPGGLARITAAVEDLATQALDTLPDSEAAARVLALRRLLDRLEGQWLGDLAALDSRGAAGADQGIPAASTASWLRNRLRLGATAASNAVHTARALFRGPLTTTAQALCHGDISAAHAAALATAPTTSPPRWPPRPSRCWWRRPDTWTYPGCDASSATCTTPPTPTAPTAQAQRRHERRGFWWATTIEGMVRGRLGRSISTTHSPWSARKLASPAP
jgi:hypothetical protein